MPSPQRAAVADGARHRPPRTWASAEGVSSAGRSGGRGQSHRWHPWPRAESPTPHPPGMWYPPTPPVSPPRAAPSPSWDPFPGSSLPILVPGQAPWFSGHLHVELCYRAVLAQPPGGRIEGAQAPAYPSPRGWGELRALHPRGDAPAPLWDAGSGSGDTGVWAPAEWGLAATAGAWHTQRAQDMPVGSFGTRSTSGLCSVPRPPGSASLIVSSALS